MESSEIKKKLGGMLKNDAPNVGELCAIWIAGVVAYAIVTRIEPFYMQGWYEFRFLTLRQLPPREHEWRVKYEHLQGDEFTIDNHPACIIALNVGACILPDDAGPDVIQTKSWQEMINGKRPREDDDRGGGGCGNNCDSCDS